MSARDIVPVLTMLVLVTALILSMVYGVLRTGPNCPGADPNWLGWCSEAPRD